MLLDMWGFCMTFYFIAMEKKYFNKCDFVTMWSEDFLGVSEI